jgi:hypothetical protein
VRAATTLIDSSLRISRLDSSNANPDLHISATRPTSRRRWSRHCASYSPGIPMTILAQNQRRHRLPSSRRPHYPAVIVRFYERDDSQRRRGPRRASSRTRSTNDPGKYIRYKHYLYSGRYRVRRLRALKRGSRSSSPTPLVQTLDNGRPSYGVHQCTFLQRIYAPDAVNRACVCRPHDQPQHRSDSGLWRDAGGPLPWQLRRT